MDTTKGFDVVPPATVPPPYSNSAVRINRPWHAGEIGLCSWQNVAPSFGGSMPGNSSLAKGVYS